MSTHDTTVQHYDFILCGGGAAGLSLALHLIRSPLRDRSILVIDKDAKDRNDRTWSFWTDQPTLFDSVVYRSWNQLRLAGEGFDQTIDLRDYRYKMIRGLDLYRFARRELSANGNVTFLQGVAESIKDSADRAYVSMGRQTFSGTWVFDSRFKPSEIQPDLNHYHYLKLHFKGWEIETDEPAFTPHTATFLDFRTPQRDSTRFFYVLPLSERHALVEYTLFSTAILKRDECECALKDYLKSALGIDEYRVVAEEGGVLPITDQPFPRRAGQHVMTVGVKAGRIKPTTGFAFLRIQHDSAAIVQSLLKCGHPFGVPPDSRRYRLYDSLLLQIMYRHGGQISRIFATLFARNPIDRVFRFLDEIGSVRENLRLIVTLPPKLFLQAWFRSKVMHVITGCPVQGSVKPLNGTGKPHTH